MNLVEMVKAALSPKDGACALCEDRVEKNSRVLLIEGKVGAGVFSKKIIFLVHEACAIKAKDLLSERITELVKL